MGRFDRALVDLVRLCEETDDFETVERAAVVRDLRGRLRLVLKPKQEGLGFNADELSARLEAELGEYYEGPPWLTTDTGDAGRLGSKVLELSREWSPTYEETASGEEKSPLAGRWRIHERHVSKHSWLDTATGPAPWKLGDGPAIITFHSFKGGVGRSTALTSCAWQLAAAGRRLAVVDLDVEGPGIGPLFGADTEDGVLDFLLDFTTAGSRDLTHLRAEASELGDQAPRVTVFPAGPLDWPFLEKLARLDFVAADPWAATGSSPVEAAINALLHAVRGELEPDYILLDARSGLHDLAGLSLHGLAHLDVLLARSSRADLEGLSLVVQALARRTPPDRLRSLVCHTMAPTDLAGELYREETERFRSASHKAFSSFVYAAIQGDDPAEEDSTAAHYPWVIRRKSELENFSRLSAVREALFSEDYRKLVERIVELCSPSQEEEEGAP